MLLKNSEWRDEEILRAERPGERIAALLRRLWRVLAERRAARQTLRVLTRLDDRTLRDIGIDRADLPGGLYGKIGGWPWR
jgi:uncharacterized protein YjiS (DUF1127 family)